MLQTVSTKRIGAQAIPFENAGLRVAPKPHGFGTLALATVLVDIVGLALGFAAGAILADGLRTLLGIPHIGTIAFLGQRLAELGLLTGLTLGIFAFGGLYHRANWELDEIRRIIAGIGLIALFDTAIQFVLADHNSRFWLLLAYPVAAFSIILLRMGLRACPLFRDAMTSHIVLIGSKVTPERLTYEMRGSRSGPIHVVGHLDFSKVTERDPQVLDQMIDRLARNVDVSSGRIVTMLAPDPTEIEEAGRLIGLLNAAGRPWSVTLPFGEMARNGLSLQNMIGSDMVLAEMRPTRPGWLVHLFKRSFDLVAGTLMTLALAPVLLILSGLLIAEGGPVFFRQFRVGRNGKRFWCYKFRSMRPDAQERLAELLASDPSARAEWDKYQKLQNDPRVTPVGEFLRKTSLDELPQLFNVLTGEMSLVGPRPIIAPEIEGYAGDKAYFDSPDFAYYKRCTPGITGLWQVSGRSDTSHGERVRLDRWYARNWSFWLDLLIIFRTVRVVLFRKGSA